MDIFDLDPFRLKTEEWKFSFFFDKNQGFTPLWKKSKFYACFKWMFS